ncbi:MAG: NAD(P)/FAD-dependent oxidoreductase [Myxococcales bacterium]|nr:NAD(P)/FAD-dependent oxidoreductase [Myxococcales bacterium]
MERRYDVIIVGARCAGASLAAFLSRGGMKVLMVDKARMPSDQVLSTNTLHRTGVSVLDELGLGTALRQLCPAMTSMRYDWFGAILDLDITERAEYCPRRYSLDGLLQEAALKSGAELWDRTKVSGLMTERGRTAGVYLTRADGTSGSVRADLVVGADGRKSRVAQWVGSEELLGYDAPRGMYWSYWPAPRSWGHSHRFPAGMYLYRRGEHISVAFHAQDDQLLIGTLPLNSEIDAFRQRPLDSLRERAAQVPAFEETVQQEPCEAVRGYLAQRYFVRRPVGPGWLLLGDAGVHKDFVSGDGISEALLQARSAAQALLSNTPRDIALERWWRQRDVDALPLFFHSQDVAQPGKPGELDRLVLNKVAEDAELKRRFAGTMIRESNPYEMLRPTTAAGWVLSAALRGKPGILSEFLSRGKRVAAVKRELALREALLRRATSEAWAPTTAQSTEAQETTPAQQTPAEQNPATA